MTHDPILVKLNLENVVCPGVVPTPTPSPEPVPPTPTPPTPPTPVTPVPSPAPQPAPTTPPQPASSSKVFCTNDDFGSCDFCVDGEASYDSFSGLSSSADVSQSCRQECDGFALTRGFNPQDGENGCSSKHRIRILLQVAGSKLPHHRGQ